MPVELEAPRGITAHTSMGIHPVPWPHGPVQQSAVGRLAAVAALAAAGSADRAVPRDPDGRPRFPRGFPGSISHTEHLAVAIVVPGAEAVGVDIENAAVTERMARFVFSERERHTLLAPVGRYLPRELFAAKEAAFKALNGRGAPGGFVFWRIGLTQSGGVLTASYREESVPVRVRSQADLSLAVAIRH
ncbi:4'-phosphopantetheinyl transferase superfamily protein [Streptomyces kronopolitis]|uniref:4'-phosphopantetheinyl transferase superfamily protein n=1 Tax=Streptomyces kronopolitis TaxID=1612435 RepID=UPI0020BD9357|nr:4'-phosphopantetheinyl transferase superfamily protein [Streptomyces kronopolitis]MCL6296864.1 4'-phosphopantetheinyl transferase superfamily protein [Streptomyces kronopolitis]